MQVRGRIFPYPVLNKNQQLSGYKDKNFTFQYEPEENEVSYTLRNVTLSTDSEYINKLISDGKVGVCVIVECSHTLYRKAFLLPNHPKNIELRKADFSDQVDISLFAFAKDDLTLSSKEFDDFYDGIDIKVDKDDILAADDGFRVSFQHDESEGNLVQSIFAIVIDHNLKEGDPYVVNCALGRKIWVYLPEKQYQDYKIIYTVPSYKKVFFAMFLVPALIEALSQCQLLVKSESKPVEDIADQYPWFRSIMASYQKIKGAELTTDVLGGSDFSPCKVAQELLGNPLAEALTSLVKGITDPEENANE